MLGRCGESGREALRDPVAADGFLGVEKADYLSASTPLPLFSARLITLLTAHDPRLSGYPSTLVASPRLVELCTSAHLNIGFTPVTMAG